ncbi:hypothetical protein E2562_020633 [Oryza meyeriana var. granulata]|uniref:Uncharacterized protein n=1 Tax=Oryza meyeriana var. granulata TaxID=110450 RepID=A0A6G1DYU2_9ORYZ|nr:hypothetical protein E2562_020633 [Oryza meyeriana var. granulata]
MSVYKWNLHVDAFGKSKAIEVGPTADEPKCGSGRVGGGGRHVAGDAAHVRPKPATYTRVPGCTTPSPWALLSVRLSATARISTRPLLH